MRKKDKPKVSQAVVSTTVHVKEKSVDAANWAVVPGGDITVVQNYTLSVDLLTVASAEDVVEMFLNQARPTLTAIFQRAADQVRPKLDVRVVEYDTPR